MRQHVFVAGLDVFVRGTPWQRGSVRPDAVRLVEEQLPIAGGRFRVLIDRSMCPQEL